MSAHRVRKATKVMLAPRAHKVYRVHRVRKATKAIPGRKARRVPLAGR